MVPPESTDLWERILEFPLDAPGSPCPFTVRLSHEQQWPLTAARAAVLEYRKFAFLAVVAGHPVSPSHAIDQVWHLHLLHTRSYWEEWCPKVLGMTLHHEPTKGGRVEEEKFGDWYARTLESYRRFFGHPKLGWIWPDPELKRQGEGVFRYIDITRHWCLRRPWLPRPPYFSTE